MPRALLLLILSIPAILAQAPPPTPTFANTIRPFLETHCQSCHNGKLHSGDVNFEVLKYATNLTAQTGTWENTAYVLKTGRMPPPGLPRPPETEATAARTMIETALAQITERKPAAAPPTPEWLTWQVDPERTGWARAESTLTKANAAKLELQWKAQLDTTPTRINGYSTLTDPLIAEGVRTAGGIKKVVYTASAENNIYALDAATGAVLWQRRFPNNAKPPTPTGNCPNNLNATPVIDKPNSLLYVLSNEGKLRARLVNELDSLEDRLQAMQNEEDGLRKNILDLETLATELLAKLAV